MIINISLQAIVGILLVHFVADFVFQTEWMATNKSKNVKALLSHVLVYTLVTIVCYVFLLPDPQQAKGTAAAYFGWLAFTAYITFFLHFLTDYVTSQFTASKAAKQQWYLPFPRLGFFALIGLDQLLHYVQLFATYIFFT